MSVIQKNVLFNERSVKVNMPMKFIKELELTKDNPGIKIYMEDNKIVIEKAN
ncbi:MAG: hypothetical protein ACRDD7_08285 [Peptostreptococcaceae bacterium]